jgi:signal transduction histidine kinase
MSLGNQPDQSDSPAQYGPTEMAGRIQTFNWAATSLGVPSSWPQGLRTVLSILLNSSFPMQLLWGPEYIHFYNDAYIPIAADKHPAAFGRAGALVWPEIWDQVEPMLSMVRTTGEATWSDDQMLLLDRYGELEEGYFTFSYSPIQGPQGDVDGVFVTVTETTRQVISARRLHTVRDLGTVLARATSEGEASRLIGDVLAKNAADLPFMLLYLFDGQRQLRLAQATHLSQHAQIAPPLLALSDDVWPLAECLASGQASLITSLPAELGQLPGGPWGVPANRALALPLISTASSQTLGVLIAGLSPRLRLDDDYRDFIERVASQIAGAISIARSRAAIESAVRVRDDFLSIAAHELKNPLTPIIGRLQMLHRQMARTNAAQAQIGSVEKIIGETQRLVRLIDSLLDLSQLQSGQISIRRQLIDLGTIAQRIAAEMQPIALAHTLHVQVPSYEVLVQGDELRLDQVARNLISNAVKYSPAGSTVTLSIHSANGQAQLAVADNGPGIDAAALPHLFERYYRTEASSVQAPGGLGVGLYVVYEIVRLHGGDVQVASQLGQGSTFRVVLPLAEAQGARD